MDVTLSPELTQQMQRELAAGHYPSASALIEQAVRRLLDEQQRAASRRAALRRMGQAVDEAGLYDRTLLPDQ